MIVGYGDGDITAPSNKSDIIIGMNSTLQDVTGIGLQFVRDSVPTRAIQLGSVISFKFDATRNLHMIICHTLDKGGWVNADRHVRFGLDHLEYLERMDPQKDRDYSIVRIGTGRVGTRDDADHVAINTAMADSYLPLTLFIYKGEHASADVRAMHRRPALRAYRAWAPNDGELLNMPLAA